MRKREEQIHLGRVPWHPLPQRYQQTSQKLNQNLDSARIPQEDPFRGEWRVRDAGGGDKREQGGEFHQIQQYRYW
jgi:hypothetical protein